jgi:hypothetical protein
VEVPWEGEVQKMTIQRCTNHHAKLKHDLEQLDLPTGSKQSLEILFHSLEYFIDVYKTLGPTTDGFVDLLRRHRKHVMGPDKWPKIEKRVSKEKAKSISILRKDQSDEC